MIATPKRFLKYKRFVIARHSDEGFISYDLLLVEFYAPGAYRQLEHLGYHKTYNKALLEARRLRQIRFDLKRVHVCPQRRGQKL